MRFLLLTSLKSIVSTKVVVVILCLMFSGALSSFFTGCVTSPTSPPKTDTIEVHDTVKVRDTVKHIVHDTVRVLDTVGSGVATNLIASYMNLQFPHDSMAISNATKNWRDRSDAAQLAMLDSVCSIIQASVNKSLAYIKTVDSKTQINNAAVTALLETQRDKFLRVEPIKIGVVLTYIIDCRKRITDTFAEAIFQVKAL